MPTVLADGIGVEGLLLLGFIFFVVPFLLVVGIEWVIIAVITRPGRWPALRFSFTANLISLLAGIPVWYVFLFSFERLPSDLHLYYDAYWLWMITKYSTYFGVTVAVEALAGFLWIKARPDVRRRRLVAAVVLANIASYSVLSPAYHYLTRPRYIARQLTSDTGWAPQGLGPIIYLDRRDRLMRVDADGRNQQLLVDYPMDAYLLSEDLRTCLFVRGDRLFVANVGDGSSPRQVGRNVWVGWAAAASFALSPDQNWAAYLSEVSGARSVELVDLHTGHARTVATVVDNVGSLGWGNDGLWVYGYGGSPAPKSIPPTPPSSETMPYAAPSPSATKTSEYRSGGRYPNDDLGSEEFCADDCADLDACVRWDLAGCWAYIRRKDETSQNPPLLMLSDNPGIGSLRHRRLGEISFLPGSRLCILEDESFKAIYLLDPDAGRVGKLVDGHYPIVLSAKYKNRH